MQDQEQIESIKASVILMNNSGVNKRLISELVTGALRRYPHGYNELFPLINELTVNMNNEPMTEQVEQYRAEIVLNASHFNKKKMNQDAIVNHPSIPLKPEGAVMGERLPKETKTGFERLYDTFDQMLIGTDCGTKQEIIKKAKDELELKIHKNASDEDVFLLITNHIKNYVLGMDRGIEDVVTLTNDESEK